MENKTPEEILNEFETKSTFILSQTLIEQMIIPAMEEYGKQQYNQAVLDCMENARTTIVISGSKETIEIHENSMKKLLKQ